MISAHILEYIVLALALTGLAAVIVEMALRDRSLFGEIISDVRRMAEPTRLPEARSFGSQSFSYDESANSNELRKAA